LNEFYDLWNTILYYDVDLRNNLWELRQFIEHSIEEPESLKSETKRQKGKTNFRKLKNYFSKRNI